MATKKKGINKKKFYFINFVLKVPEMQRPEEYVKVFSSISDNKIQVQTYGDRRTFITLFQKLGENYVGTISNAIFVNPDSTSINSETYEISCPDIDPSEGLSLKQWDFYFFPHSHRMAIVGSCSLSQVLKFFKKAFYETLGDEDYYSIYIEKDRGVLEMIVNSAKVSRLEMELSYSNNDNYDDWKDLLDEEMRSSNTKQAKFSFKSLSGRYLNLAQTKFMNALLWLTKSNGHAKATIEKEKGRCEIVDTNNHPKITQLEYENTPVQQLDEIVRHISNNTDLANGG